MGEEENGGMKRSTGTKTKQRRVTRSKREKGVQGGLSFGNLTGVVQTHGTKDGNKKQEYRYWVDMGNIVQVGITVFNWG